MQTHYYKLEKMYHGHKLNEFYNAKLKISEGEAEIIFPTSEKYHHAANAVHGAIYFKALDDVGFFAANSVVEDVLVLTSHFNIYFLKPVVTGDLRGVGKIVYQSNSQFIVDTILYDSDGNEIGRGTGTYIRSKIKLSELSYGK